MSVITTARARLISDGALVALVGQNIYANRVPKSVNPQPSNYIILQKIANLPDNHLEGWSGLDSVLLQFACIAGSFDAAEAIRSAARAAITAGNSATFWARVEDERDLYLPDIERNELQMDVAISYRES